ncbi:MPN domain-containing protein [Plasmodiophora brassicae]|uniref:COP9 signalosome complex subunit 5 n=1 Tax=Plasmodiophora brassicae TaxID=37360 RepID=A0A3P3Y784_PLABS|nr:unnamed protein product [Plasmodiophora brassicae]
MPGDDATSAISEHDRRLFAFNRDAEERIDRDLRAATPAQPFTSCRIAALATMKMMQHALEGVETGVKRGSKPLEIMGLLLGKCDGSSIVVTDCFALPVEGTESRVVADDESVMAHMVKLSEQLQKTRNERFIGWYHSHPFDVEAHSHCFLSATDVSTQWSWQHTLTPKWVAIVVDPLRSLAKQRPELGVFRCYPPTYKPAENLCPDGALCDDDQGRQIRWGKLYHRYYELKVENVLSSTGAKILDVLSRKHLWMKVLSSSSIMDPENRQRFPDRIAVINAKLESVDLQTIAGRPRKGKSSSKDHTGHLVQAVESASELSFEHCHGHCSQIMKALLFNRHRSDNDDPCCVDSGGCLQPFYHE